jgi:hypothetical protein
MNKRELQYFNDHINEQLNRLIKIKKFHIPMFSGRPNRTTIISLDEIINLKILLETCQDSATFIKKI